MIRILYVRAVCAAALAAIGIALSQGPVLAQTDRPGIVPAEQIEQRLIGRRTRGAGSQVSDTDQDTVRGLLESRRTRGWNEHDRTRFLTATQNFPQFDFEIYFDLDSARIRPESLPQLEEVARALASSGLKERLLFIAGHTDRHGSIEHNQDLSERRAEAVRSFLAGKASVPDKLLEAAGFGFNKLKNSSNPYAAENRRVQIINLTP